MVASRDAECKCACGVGGERKPPSEPMTFRAGIQDWDSGLGFRTGTNETRPSQVVLAQRLATGVKKLSGEDRI